MNQPITEKMGVCEVKTMRLIDADALKAKKTYSHERHEYIVPVAEIDWMPTVDAVPVVRCKDCIKYVKSEHVNGEKMCVKDADWCEEDGCYYGFTDYPSPDFYCADGERRTDGK